MIIFFCTLPIVLVYLSLLALFSIYAGIGTDRGIKTRSGTDLGLISDLVCMSKMTISMISRVFFMSFDLNVMIT